MGATIEVLGRSLGAGGRWSLQRRLGKDFWESTAVGARDREWTSKGAHHAVNPGLAGCHRGCIHCVHL